MIHVGLDSNVLMRRVYSEQIPKIEVKIHSFSRVSYRLRHVEHSTVNCYY